ncbi:TPA: hypothetical protein DCX16_00260 [bacterium]|nr:hypothetical protein [bacterium]
MEVIAAVGFIATFLGVCIAVSAYFNGKHIKEGVAEIGGMIQEITKLLDRMDARAEKNHREIVELTEKRHGEIVKLTTEFHREIVELTEKRHGELIRLFGRLFEFHSIQG